MTSRTDLFKSQQNREPEVTTQPLKDWLTKTNDLRARGQLDLNSPTQFTIDAKVNSDCKLTDVVVVENAGDPRLVDVARDLMSAISDTSLLIYLGDHQNQNTRNLSCVSMPLHFNFRSDLDEISASVEHPADTPERAAETTKMYNMMITMVQIKKRGTPQEGFYKNLHAISEGKQIIVYIRVSRLAISEVLK